MPQNDLYNQFYAVVQKGDEEAAKAFIVEHFKEFPEAVQDKITFAFFEDALDKSVEEDGQMADFKGKGLEILEALGDVKKALEEEKKMQTVKQGLGI